MRIEKFECVEAYVVALDFWNAYLVGHHLSWGCVKNRINISEIVGVCQIVAGFAAKKGKPGFSNIVEL